MTPATQSRLIFLDVETTGLTSSDEIIELACVRVDNLHFTSIDSEHTFHTYVKPTVDSSESALRVHGITKEFLQDKPSFDMICDSFLSFINNDVLIAHNAQFDIGFLNRALVKIGYAPLNNRVIDSLVVARRMFVGQAVGLDRLPKLLGIEFKRNLHSALEDAKILAKVYAAMMRPKVETFSFSESAEIDLKHYEMCQALIEESSALH